MISGLNGRLGSFAMVVFGAAGVAGSIAPWAYVHQFGDLDGTTRGTADYMDMGGGLTVYLMAGVLVAGWVTGATRRWRRWFMAAAGVAALIAGVVAWVDGTDIADGWGSMPAPNVDAAWGVWLVGAAALSTVIVVGLNVLLHVLYHGGSPWRSAGRQLNAA